MAKGDTKKADGAAAAASAPKSKQPVKNVKGGKAGMKRHQKNRAVDALSGIRDPAFGRMAERAGIKRKGRSMSAGTRQFMGEFTEQVMRDACILALNRKKKTITASDIKNAFLLQGFTIAC